MSFGSRHKLLLDMPRIGDICRAEYGDLHFKNSPCSLDVFLSMHNYWSTMRIVCYAATSFKSTCSAQKHFTLCNRDTPRHITTEAAHVIVPE